MKSILISDHAIWCALMMNGIKKTEVRKGTALYKATKKLIDEYGFAEFYVYCTKGKPNLWLPYEYDCFELDEASQPYLSDEPMLDVDTKMNGKVIFKFRCYKVEEILYFDEMQIPDGYEDYDGNWVDTSKHCKDFHWFSNGKLEQSCLTYDELHRYLGKKTGYAIHISDLEIFDKPKELSEFRHWISYKKCKKCPYKKYFGSNPCLEIETLNKAPQSWCYVEASNENS